MTSIVPRMWHDWRRRSRYLEVSRVCLPLVTGMAATTVMEFTDRIFLSHYSVDAISAVVPAGVTAFLLLCLFGGVAGYVSVFIAQYHGSGRPERIGAVLWQGIFFTLLAGFFFLLFASLATGPLFAMVGHSLEVRILEEQYFRILCQGGVLYVATQALSGFFTGRGKTRPVMLANIMGMAVNIPLDYALINGVWGLPELGIVGAGIATVMAWGVTVLVLALFVFSPHLRQEYRLLESVAVERRIFVRLLRYGVPAALQFSLDIFAFTFFILLVGRMGTVPLAASNIVISISSLAFMPALGFSFGITSMAGQALGRGRPAEARAAAWSGIHILLAYTLILDLVFIFFPDQIVSIFIHADQAGSQYTEIADMAAKILGLVALYILLDVFYMIFAAVLKGAGDTRFLLLAIFGASLFCMIIPLYAGITYMGMGIYAAWSCIVGFIAVLCLILSLRYRAGRWEKMLVIERQR